MWKFLLFVFLSLPAGVFAQTGDDEAFGSAEIEQLLPSKVDSTVESDARDLTDQLRVLLELSDIQAEGIYSVNLESSRKLKQLSSLRGKNLHQLLEEVNHIREIRNENIRKVLREDQVVLFNRWQENQDSTACVRKDMIEKTRKAGASPSIKNAESLAKEAADSSRSPLSVEGKEENKAKLMTDRMGDRLHLDNQQKVEVFDINLKSIREVNRVRIRDRRQRNTIMEQMNSVNTQRDNRIKEMLHQKQQNKYRDIRKATTPNKKSSTRKKK